MKSIPGKKQYIVLLIALILAVSLPCTIIKASEKKSSAEDKPYNGLFTTDHVHEINVDIDEADWKKILEHPLERTKYNVSVTIDGETIDQVAFSTKGNSSLNNVVKQGSNRYSFKLKFNKYDKKQTYHGLDQMKLSNLYGDESGMEDYISYRTITEAGGYTPLAAYAWLTINGEDYGLYMTAEELGDGWIARTQKGVGTLYDPEPIWTSFKSSSPGLKSDKDSIYERLKASRKYYGDTDMGADLVYIDNDIDSYPAIFDNNQTKVTKKDKKRLIKSLKVLNSDNPASVINTDEVIGYFAGHNFTMNYDSYTGMMLHNYNLYENQGILSAVAWDYNAAFGGFLKLLYPEMRAIDIINWGIDTPLYDAELSDRPFWAWIANDKTFLGEYHTAMDQLLKNYFESGRCEKEMNDIHNMIKPYIAKDPTFLYTQEEFENSYKGLKAFCRKRSESIRRQLDGELSPDTERQKEEEKVKAEDSDLP